MNICAFHPIERASDIIHYSLPMPRLDLLLCRRLFEQSQKDILVRGHNSPHAWSAKIRQIPSPLTSVIWIAIGKVNALRIHSLLIHCQPCRSIAANSILTFLLLLLMTGRRLCSLSLSTSATAITLIQYIDFPLSRVKAISTFLFPSSTTTCTWSRWPVDLQTRT